MEQNVRYWELRIQEVARLWKENPELVARHLNKVMSLQKDYLRTLEAAGINPNQLMYPAFLETVLRTG